MPKLLEQVQNLIRTRHYSYRTEQTYVHWIKQYIYFQARDIRRKWGSMLPVVLDEQLKRVVGMPL